LVVEDKVTQYATALETVDPALQAAELERLATGSDAWSVEALYMRAESSVRAREFGKAEEGFQRVVAEAPDSEYAPRAADGLAFLAENSGDYEAALKGYQQVYSRWSGTFTGRRQPFNIGRVLESLERFEEAVRSYEDQVAGFPGSRVALQATAALDRLRGEHPALFPDLPVVEVAGDAGAAS
jgi:TolA-binding protein